MVERTLRIEGHGFFRAGDGGIMLLGFVVGLGQEQMDFGVARMLFGGELQEPRRFGVVAGFVSFVGGLEVIIVAHTVRGCPGTEQSRREQKSGKERNSNRIHFGHGCNSHRY